MVGFEALVRMNHPELGVLTPARFLDALLANGAGPALTHRMLQGTAQSLKRLAQYNPAGDWTYAVNVTGDLPIQDNPQWLRKHVEAVGLDPASLIIEVPEGTLSNDVSAWHRVLTQARLMGSGVSLDDFGCHAANLERLLLLPLSEVKVDRMFLEHAVHDQDARRLLESMNLMIKNLGLVSVVEGISSPEMLAIAVDAGFDLGQGFHLGVPLSLSATEALLAARNPAA
jgi:EAL domain-containing protein (putative c-di-GMP-specific phosphodiesterase class I)